MHTKSILFVASLFGMAIAGGGVGCSSSSSGSPAAPGDDSGATDSGGGSSSGGGEAAAGGCTKGADCTGGQVCCASIASVMSMMGSCQAAPCPTLPVVNMPVQFCAGDSDCTAPAKCGALMFMGAAVPGLMSCGTPSTGDGGNEGGSSSGGTDGGSSSGSSTEGGTDSGSSSGGGSEGGTDAPTG
jgi:hypothetical protein